LSTESAETDPWLTVREAQQLLPVRRSWLYEHLADGRVPGTRFGRSWRIRQSVVAALAAGGIAALRTEIT
jgi:excisionase family DNA binding protein